MDIDSTVKAIGLFTSALSALKQAIDLLPKSSKKTEALEAFQNAEHKFKIAEVESAKQIGYEICLNHFPPGIMVKRDRDKWQCLDCQEVLVRGEKKSNWNMRDPI